MKQSNRERESLKKTNESTNRKLQKDSEREQAKNFEQKAN